MTDKAKTPAKRKYHRACAPGDLSEVQPVSACTRWDRLNFRPPPPARVAEPDQPVLVEYVSDGRVALITFNRPHADNAITTELAAGLIEILETIAARIAVRVVILAGAGDRAFSIGGGLRQRKKMTKEAWLRQRPVFDRAPAQQHFARLMSEELPAWEQQLQDQPLFQEALRSMGTIDVQQYLTCENLMNVAKKVLPGFWQGLTNVFGWLLGLVGVFTTLIYLVFIMID